ncbi:hypothetical protein CDAR_188511 [Caerostris darwini]|uniref:Uncharacterized protein n=1 Tax=Caerostris darwini TaxID=1538125 RepID=A0AAV4V762_9ARAC|nr:hypothetical protein CDAR_188381 [Caerostris darwini]GIY65774.1 hypothetical protein CDAR_188511 [Caerostris darwini]
MGPLRNLQFWSRIDKEKITTFQIQLRSIPTTTVSFKNETSTMCVYLPHSSQESPNCLLKFGPQKETRRQIQRHFSPTSHKTNKSRRAIKFRFNSLHPPFAYECDGFPRCQTPFIVFGNCG